MRRFALLAVTLVAVGLALSTAGKAPADGECVFTTNAATSITTTGATLNGSFSGCGGGTGWRFDYGLTTSYGFNTGTGFAGDGPHSASISGLTACTTYHYRIQNGGNSALNGGDVSFTTDGCLPSTTTTITGNTPNPSLVGQDVTVDVLVTSGVAGTPTGTVTVSDGVGETCDATLSGGAGSCALTPTAAGADTLTAHYNGDSQFAASTSAGVSQTVNTTATLLAFLTGQPGSGKADIRATLYADGVNEGSGTLLAIAPSGDGPGGSQLEELSWAIGGSVANKALRLEIDERTACTSRVATTVKLYFGSADADSALAASGLSQMLHLVGVKLLPAVGSGLQARSRRSPLAACNTWEPLAIWRTAPSGRQ